MGYKRLISILVIFSFFMVMGSFSFAEQKQASNSKLVNINTAGIAQLVTLPRVGEKIAQRIVDFRKKHGKFKRIQDLMKVKGIGEKMFAQLKKRITV